MSGIKRLLNPGIFWYLVFFPITKAGFFLICIQAFYLPKVNSPFIHFSFRTDSILFQTFTHSHDDNTKKFKETLFTWPKYRDVYMISFL